MSAIQNDDDVFRPFGLDPNDEYFDELLTAAWAVEYGNGQASMTLALQWYEEAKATRALLAAKNKMDKDVVPDHVFE